MKTKLYSMWLKFCKASDKWRAMACSEWIDSKTGHTYSPYDVIVGNAKNIARKGIIYFNYKQPGTKARDDSPEYDAWNAFMTAKESSDSIIEFLIKNFKTFKNYLPATCIFLDLHNLKPEDMLKQNNKPLVEELKRALISDIDSRKSDK